MNSWIDSVKGKLFLSPMAGFSDLPYRKLCREFGCPVSVTEFVSAKLLVSDFERYKSALMFETCEMPIIFQIFGSNAEEILAACKLAEQLEPDGFELNAGCPAKKVSGKGSGSGLLLDLLEYKKILSLMVKEVNFPISAKIRLGYFKNNFNFQEAVKIAEAEGVQAVTIHGRSRDMSYNEEANWDAIGEASAKHKINIIGNGDITSRQEAQAKIAKYNLLSVSVGRAARGNPWIFSSKSKPKNLSIRLDVIKKHLHGMTKFYGENGVRLFRKHLKFYLEDVDVDKTLMNQLLSASTSEKLNLLLGKIL